MEEVKNIIDKLSCPLLVNDYETITMSHGGGGKIMGNLIDKMILQFLSNDFINEKHDGAVFLTDGHRLAFTTDSYVINPIFFPGGDIGELAVYGTVNDLSMCGAKPLYLSLGLILEEGFVIKDLEKIIISVKNACERTGVKIITGDTKVVEKGKGDKIFINTAGIGIVKDDINISPSRVEEGDVVLLSGDIGRHGIAIMTTRENLDFESKIKSDCAPLNDIVQKLLESGIDIHCLRDLTRGGLGSALNEIASKAKVEIEINEIHINVIEEVKGICEILGFDPLNVANEGRFIAFVKKKDAAKALKILKEEEDGKYASIIGVVKKKSLKIENGKKENGIVILKSILGTNRILDMLSGEQLPRIC
ncbi:MAG: hydrogenase expression/formation protein HypE [Ignavibacteriae bacterium]|nr:hydrogenase expression/formation protein HypE [Ignavibacteriota bacterium]